jgi:hypothetical protein
LPADGNRAVITNDASDNVALAADCAALADKEIT